MMPVTFACSGPITIGGIFATAIFIAGQPASVGVTFASMTDAGQLVGAITVSTNIPGTYLGTISIGGASASSFSLSPSSNLSSAAYPCSLYVAQANLPAGSYSISLTAVP